MIVVLQAIMSDIVAWYDAAYAILPLLIMFCIIAVFTVVSRFRKDDGHPKVLLHSAVWTTLAGMILFIAYGAFLSARFEHAVAEHIAANMVVEHATVTSMDFSTNAKYVHVELTLPAQHEVAYITARGDPVYTQQSHVSTASTSHGAQYDNTATIEETENTSYTVNILFQYNAYQDLMVPQQGQESSHVAVRRGSDLENYLLYNTTNL